MTSGKKINLSEITLQVLLVNELQGELFVTNVIEELGNGRITNQEI